MSEYDGFDWKASILIAIILSLFILMVTSDNEKVAFISSLSLMLIVCGVGLYCILRGRVT